MAWTDIWEVLFWQCLSVHCVSLTAVCVSTNLVELARHDVDETSQERMASHSIARSHQISNHNVMIGQNQCDTQSRRILAGTLDWKKKGPSCQDEVPLEGKLQAETTIAGRLLGHATLKSWSGDACCVLENWIVGRACWRGGCARTSKFWRKEPPNQTHSMHPLRSVDVLELSVVATLQAFSSRYWSGDFFSALRAGRNGSRRTCYGTRVPERQ